METKFKDTDRISEAHIGLIFETKTIANMSLHIESRNHINSHYQAKNDIGTSNNRKYFFPNAISKFVDSRIKETFVSDYVSN